MSELLKRDVFDEWDPKLDAIAGMSSSPEDCLNRIVVDTSIGWLPPSINEIRAREWMAKAVSQSDLHALQTSARYAACLVGEAAYREHS